MSLLPGRILPAEEPLGTTSDGSVVTINKNWWLLIYNLCAQTIGTGPSGPPGTPGSPGGTPVSDSSLITPAMILASLDTDAADADAIALRQMISNLSVGDVEIPQPIDTRSLLLAQDGLLPDPLPQAQPVTVVTVGGSPFTYTAAFDGEVVITGTVTSVAIVRQGTSVTTGLLVGIFPIRRRDQLVVTYPAAAPTMTFLPN